MKQLITFSIGLFILLSSCKKETFVPCEGLEDLYGEWESIDSDAVARVTISNNGTFNYASGVDRTYTEQIIQCTDKVGNGWDYVLLEFEDGILAIFHNEQMDTIVFNASAYNHTNTGEIGYKRYFVKSN